MSRFVVQATWDDAPHLSESAKAELLASIPPFEREARVKGIPQLGAGAIYPISVTDITVPDFPLPKEYRRVYGLDVGWNWTAAVFFALKDEVVNGDAVVTWYLYDAYKRGQAEPVVHAEAIKSRGLWIPGVIDPASQGSSQDDGRKLIEQYTGLGLKIHKADNAVSAGILAVWQALSSGRLKVFASCSAWFAEFALYHRDERGAIVKTNDHLLDATRYAVLSGGRRAIVEPAPTPETPLEYLLVGPGGGLHDANWMGV